MKNKKDRVQKCRGLPNPLADQTVVRKEGQADYTEVQDKIYKMDMLRMELKAAWVAPTVQLDQNYELQLFNCDRKWTIKKIQDYETNDKSS